jgi:hypothetical protein
MTTQNQATYPLKIAGLAVFGLAAVNWYYSPDNAIIWGGVMTIVLLSAAVLFIMSRSSREDKEIRIRNIRRGLFGASLMLGAALVFRLAGDLEVIDANIAKRAAGVITGVILIITGNYLPKSVRSLAAQKCNPARTIAAERLLGLTLVLAGFTHSALWLFAPIDLAQISSFLIGAAVLALAIIICIWAMRGARADNQQHIN